MKRLQIILFLICVFTASNAFAQLPEFKPYTTKGHTKAQGLNIVAEFPADWTQEEGKRPHVVQKFTDESNGSMCLILIMPTGRTPKKEFEQLFSNPKDLSEMLGENMTMIDSKKTAYEGEPGVLLRYKAKADRAGVNISLYTMTHMVFYKKNLIHVQCSSLTEEEFKKNNALFRYVGNSIVLMDKWK